MEAIVSVDGSILGHEHFEVTPMDRGFLYGESFFETILAMGTKLILPNWHFNRMRETADRLELKFKWSDAELLFEIENMLQMSKWPQSEVRIIITGGDGLGLGIDPGDLVCRKIVFCKPLKKRPATVYQNGLSLKKFIGYHLVREPRIKSCYYVPEIQAIRKAKASGYDDILWSFQDGELTESSTANIFLVARRGDLVEIVTPPIQSGILQGITRRKVIELLTNAGIPVMEQSIFGEELAKFDEGFLTSSLSGLVPIRKIDRHELRTCRPQSVFRHFERLYGSWLSTFEA